MAETTTIARPYAQAVFELAESQKRLKEWSDALALLAAIARDPQMRAFVDNPRVTPAQIEDVLLGLASDVLDQNGKNFVKLLVENDRVVALPDIHAIYEELRAEAERTVKAEVISAFEVDQAHQQKIAEALKKRLGRDVTLEVRIDKDLVGGAIIRAGDLVIDGSVAAQLDKMAYALAH